MTVKNKKQRIEIYKKLISGWNTTPIVITDAFNISISTGIGKKKDSFSFNVYNADGKYSRQKFSGDGITTDFVLEIGPVPNEYISGGIDFKITVNNVVKTNGIDFNISSGTTISFTIPPITGIQNIWVDFKVLDDDDQARIYLWEDDDWDALTTEQKSNNMKIEGTIISASAQFLPSRKTISIRGVSVFENILNALSIIRNEGKTTPDAVIRSVLSSINGINPNRRIVGATPGEWNSLNNAVAKRDGEAFSDIQYSSSYRRAIEVIEEISSDKYTQDGQYIYWIETDYTTGNRNFIWKAKSPGADTTTEFSEGGSIIQDLKIERKIDEVVNAVIYNVGTDINGRSREFLNHNPVAQTKSGTKWKYVTTTNNILPNLIAEEINGTSNTSGDANIDSYPVDSDNEVTQKYPSSFDNSGLGYWEMSFYDRDTRTGVISGNIATATNKNTFNEAIVKEAKFRGVESTDRIIDLYSNPRFHITFSSSKILNLVNGSVYLFDYPSFNLDNKNLRLIESNEEFMKINYDFQEDEQTAIKS